jgi:hypothetical protein
MKRARQTEFGIFPPQPFSGFSHTMDRSRLAEFGRLTANLKLTPGLRRILFRIKAGKAANSANVDGLVT